MTRSTIKIAFMISLCFFVSCSEEAQNFKSWNELKEAITTNYEKHEPEFLSFTNNLKPLKHIYEIEFQDSNTVSLNYHFEKFGEAKKIVRAHLNSREVKTALSLDSISVDYLRNLYSRMVTIGCSNYFADYNESKDSIWVSLVELRYAKWNGISCSYRIYAKNIDSEQVSFFKRNLEGHDMGGILGARVIWFCNR